MTPEQMAWFDRFPAWATSCWAFGVWGAIAGSLLLLLRSRWAVTAFAISLVGFVGSRVYQYSSNAPASLNTATGTMFGAVLGIVAVALLGYAWTMRKQGVLK
jgi:hypothetical protein